ncbi:MAG TPA: carboxypeptidase-like regulatory domain-containing protein [Bacteroidales bacterium]|nr:carboxypeptidase-like regulatory domain-containing protein [Bacteroidales bacterium]
MKPFLLILCLFPLAVSAQISQKQIKANYDSMPFTEFVSKLEQNETIHFFFRKAWVDTFVVKQTQVPITLKQLLDDTFRGSSLHCFMDGPNIIITNNYQIHTTLSDRFFADRKNSQYGMLDTTEVKYAFVDRTDKNQNQGVLKFGDPNRAAGDKFNISGVIRNEENGEPIVGAQVYVKALNIGTVTDINGNYLITLPKGKHEVLFKYMGRKDISQPVMLYKNGVLNINMKESLVLLKEVVVTAERESNVQNLKTGSVKLNIEEIKQLPALMGEVDIIKTVTLLPGVQTVGEGTSGFNVRGGSADQNLVLLDDAPIFNSSHLFGFFSVFNPETIKDFELYKSGIPARFGGRISSIFDITAKQGNFKKYVVSGGISPITGKLTVEGPIIKNKLSFIVGGRTTYSNWVLRELDRTQFKNSNANFYDFSAKISFDINRNNSMGLTLYQSKDYFQLNSDTAYNFENRSARFFYKRLFNPKFYGTLSAIYSNYRYDISSNQVPALAFSLKYNIDYQSLKTSFFYLPKSNHTINFGAEVIKYKIVPGDFTPLNEESDIVAIKIPKEQGIETGLFINDEFKINDKLTVSAGLRYALFLVMGPDKVYEYQPNVTRSVESRIDSTTYPSNRIIKTYGGPEVRISSRYNLGENNSVKVSYNRIHQFLHMLTNSTAISPTDIWKMSDANIKPLIGDQVSVGYYHSLFDNMVEASVEVYYKSTKNSLDYKSGAELLLNPNLEVDILSGVGRAYGFELLLKKKSGRLNGWISYTYSRSQLKVNGAFTNEKINNGNYYPADYDKPHDLDIVVDYKVSRRINIANTFSYSTGRPITYPVAKYSFQGKQLMHYSNRNEYRIPDYMRWDVSLNLEGNLKKKKVVHSSWSLGFYNILGRNNAYSVFFKTTPRGIKGYQLSVINRPIFNITYNFKF